LTPEEGLMAPQNAAGRDLQRRLNLALILRLIMVTFLFSATFFMHLSRTPSFLTPPLIALYVVLGVTYLVTLACALALRWGAARIPLAYFHITWEVIFVTALIYVTTGKFESIFSFLYLLAVILAGILIYRRGAFLAAAMGSAAYGLILAAMELGILRNLMGEYVSRGWNSLIYDFSVNFSAMFMMAALSSYLTEKLRVTGDELEETQRDRDALEALNDNIVHSISSGLITLDLEGRITSMNEAAARMVSMKDSLARGKRINAMFPGLEDQTKDHDEKRPKRLETIWKDSGGETRFLEFKLSPLKGASGELLGTLLICDDVTELRRMEERLRKTDRLAAVGQLAAGIAHEIRNPLASISGSIQVLDADLELDRTGQRLMRIIKRETDRLNSLITDFLLYARPAPKTMAPVRLDLLVPELMEIYRHRTDIPDKLEVEIRVAPGLTVETDPKLIEQILWNLINNAVEAMPEGGRLKIIGTMAGDHELQLAEPCVRIEIEDTGPGIPREHKDRIFDPFFTTREKGTGLGLSTVYNIVESLQGAVSVEDGRKRGARFVVDLPLRVSGLESKNQEPEKRPEIREGR